MPRVFISYRRADQASSGYVWGVHESLSKLYGERNVFKDVDSIAAGENFGVRIRKTVRACDVELAFIGPGWVDARDEQGRRKIDNPDDWVRIELSEGMALDHVRVIPVLVAGAQMPKHSELPDQLQALASLHAFEWPKHGATEWLVEQIEKWMDEREATEAGSSSPLPSQPWECTVLRSQVLALAEQAIAGITDVHLRAQVERIERRLQLTRRVRMARRVDALEADLALRMLEQIPCPPVERAVLAHSIELLRDTGPGMHMIEVAKAYQRVETGEVDLPPEKHDELELLLSGRTPPEQLGLEISAGTTAIRMRAVEQARSWRQYENSSGVSPSLQRVASVIGRFYEKVAFEREEADAITV